VVKSVQPLFINSEKLMSLKFRFQDFLNRFLCENLVEARFYSKPARIVSTRNITRNAENTGIPEILMVLN